MGASELRARSNFVPPRERGVGRAALTAGLMRVTSAGF